MRKLLFYLLLLGPSLAYGQASYRNPVLPGFYPDPSVCRVGEDFYLVTSSFEYFPGVPIFHSRDLVHWEQLGHVLTRPAQLPLAKAGVSGGIFAPTIRYHNGTFYVITTNVTHGGNFLVTAKNPAGPWSDPVWIATDPAFGQLVIDPSLFFDDDGRAYLTTNGVQNGRSVITLAALDVASGKLLGPQTGIWGGTGGRYPEGPHLYKKDGWYYLLIAEGGTEYGHKVTIARSRAIGGPYASDPANPLLTHARTEAQDSLIQGLGHADLVQAANGSWWLVALGFRQLGHYLSYHTLGRETYLAPVQWPAGGWPVVNRTGMLGERMAGPTLPPHPYPAAPERDEFAGPALGLVWNYLRNPVPANYSLTERPGSLRLRGTAATLDSALGAVTWVGRRQQHFHVTATTELDFQPAQPGQEAGLTVYMDPRHHYDLLVRGSGGQRQVVLAYTVGHIRHEERALPLGPGPVQLRVTSTSTHYAFAYAQGAAAFQPLATADASLLSSEAAGGFTGVYLGLFASAPQPAGPGAFFSWFDYAGR